MTRDAGAPVPFVFVTVGTDHHPFDRLVRWVDGWLEANPGRVRCTVQAGTAETPRAADHVGYVSVQRMEMLMSEADAVICHGGPGAIAASRGSGIRPIVVPRSVKLGEHVDDHQRWFARRLANEGQILLAEDEGAFRRLLTSALDDPEFVRRPAQADILDETVRRFAAFVDPLLARRPQRLGDRLGWSRSLP